MHVIVWTYEVRPGAEQDFERVYAPEGEWAELFRRDQAYLGSELLHDVERRFHYAIMDRWESREAYDAFRRTYASEYQSLDLRFAVLRLSERLVGRFDR